MGNPRTRRVETTQLHFTAGRRASSSRHPLGQMLPYWLRGHLPERREPEYEDVGRAAAHLGANDQGFVGLNHSMRLRATDDEPRAQFLR
jgi:hypothetical protein